MTLNATFTPPRNLPLAAKAGGGFRSDGYVDGPTGSGVTDPARRFSLSRTFNGTPGVITRTEADGFSEADGRTVYSSEQAFSDTTSGKMTLLTSDDEANGGGGGFGQWGGIINWPNELLKGDEIFIRFRMFYPAGFNHYTVGGGSHVKFTRIKTLTAGGANAGLIDIYWHSQNNAEGTTYKFIKEQVDKWVYFGDSANFPFVSGQWVTFNIHYILSDVPGEGLVRVWRDGSLMVNANEATLTNATDRALDWYLFTYWNGAVPQNQSCYVDDVVITSDRDQTTVDPVSGFNWVGV